MNAPFRMATRFRYGRVNVAPNAVGGISSLCGNNAGGYDDDVLRQYVPSIFAENPHESRSARYGYVPSSEVLAGMRRSDFVPVFACEAKARDDGKNGYTKHMIRFRHRRDLEGAKGETPEVVMINSHDGSTSYQLFGGIYRAICANGLIMGETFAETRIPHKSNAVEKVIEGSYSVLQRMESAMDFANATKEIALNRDEAELFATAAHQLRFDPESPLAEAIKPARLLFPRRPEDGGNDLWRVFNVVQENTVKGGMAGFAVGEDGRRRRASAREVGGIDGNVKLNRALATLAEGMAKLKGYKLAA